MRLETQHCIIRDYEPKDEQDLCELMLQRVDALYEAYPDFTAEKSGQEIAKRCGSDEFYAVELKDNQKVIGNLYFGKRDFNTRELGFVFHSKFQRKGYGTETAKAMMQYFFDQGVHRVYAECAPGNIASWKLMRKIGMRREAHFKKNVYFHYDKDGKPIYWDTFVYASLNPGDNEE